MHTAGSGKVPDGTWRVTCQGGSCPASSLTAGIVHSLWLPFWPIFCFRDVYRDFWLNCMSLRASPCPAPWCNLGATGFETSDRAQIIRTSFLQTSSAAPGKRQDNSCKVLTTHSFQILCLFNSKTSLYFARCYTTSNLPREWMNWPVKILPSLRALYW